MSPNRHRDFAPSNVFPAGYVDALEDFIGSYASPNFRVTRFSTTQLRIVAGAGDDQVAIGIGGDWRFNTVTETRSIPGGLVDGDHDIYVTSRANDTAAEDTGTFDYGFILKPLATGTLPSGTGNEAIYRKVGTFTVAGGVIAEGGVKQIPFQAIGAAGGDLYGSFPDPKVTAAALLAGVVERAGTATPLPNNVGAVGVSTRYAREDHVHDAAVGYGRFVATIGNGSADSFVITHSLATKDLVVAVRQVGTPFAEVYPEILYTSDNTITVNFQTVPSASEFRVTIATGIAAPGTPTAATKTTRTMHTWVVPEDVKVAVGDTDYIMPFAVSLAAGENKTLVKVFSRLNSQTSGTTTFTISRNGVAIAAFTGLTAAVSALTAAMGSTSGTQALSEGDRLSMAVATIGVAPKNLSVTLVIESVI